MRKLLLAVDETEASERAAKFVERFFGGTEVAIRAVNVARNPIRWGVPATSYGWVPPVPYGGVYGWPWGYRAEDTEYADDAIAREKEHATAVARAHAPTGAEVDVEFGDVVDAITNAAEDQEADLIVVGSNHRSLLERVIDPSVSRKLVREAPRPVLVVG